MDRRDGRVFRSSQPSRTVQSFKDETNLGARITGLMRGVVQDPRLPKVPRPGLYDGPGSINTLDLSGMPKTYHEMMIKIQQAQKFFDSLPLRAKQEFDFRADLFFDAVVNPVYRQRFVELGVFKPDPAKPGKVPAHDAGTKPAPVDGGDGKAPPPAKGGGGGA